MEYYNNKLCATRDDLSVIVNYETLKKMVLRGEAERVRRPSVELPALYAVDSLPLKYKTEVYRRYPDLKAQAESGKSSVSCPLKPSDSAPLKHSTMPP